jgi:FtsH-binding integral membrane protein
VKKLAELRNEGLLDEEEFQAQKAHVLGSAQPPPPVVPPPVGMVAASTSQPAPSREERMTSLRWVNLAALVGCAVGLLMAWGTDFIASVSGISTDDGKLFGVVLVIAALVTWWRTMRTNRLNGSVVVVVWLGLLAIGVFEIIHLSSSSVVQAGSGLYLDAVAAAVGLITAALDLTHNGSSTSDLGQERSGT